MNKLEQAARALLAHWDTPAWKYLKPTGDLMADLREALAEPELNLNCKSVQKRLATVWGYVKAEQAEQEPVAFQIICPRCKVDRVTTQCPNRGSVSDCPMTATAQNAAPVRTKDLTDDEKLELARSSVGKSRHWLVEAAITAYKEKNK